MKTIAPHSPFTNYRAVILLLFLIQMSHNIHGQALEEYQWKNRILLLVAERQDSQPLQAQLKLFQDQAADLKDRDLLLFLIADAKVYDASWNQVDIKATELRSTFGIKEGFDGVLLIGKDGGVKLRKPFPQDVQSIFDVIDSMPMRKAEMKNNG